MEQEPRGRAENRRDDDEKATQAEAALHETTVPPNAIVTVLEPTSYKRAMTGDEYDEWATVT
jgi:hypothetical protein